VDLLIYNYLFNGTQFKKTGIENLEQLAYFSYYSLQFWILIRASNYQSYTFLNSTLFL